jgi:hypothetical protein
MYLLLLVLSAVFVIIVVGTQQWRQQWRRSIIPNGGVREQHRIGKGNAGNHGHSNGPCLNGNAQ